MGINSSNYTGTQVGFGNDGYLYTLADDFFIGTFNNRSLRFINSGATIMTISG